MLINLIVKGCEPYNGITNMSDAILVQNNQATVNNEFAETPFPIDKIINVTMIEHGGMKYYFDYFSVKIMLPSLGPFDPLKTIAKIQSTVTPRELTGAGALIVEILCDTILPALLGSIKPKEMNNYIEGEASFPLEGSQIPFSFKFEALPEYISTDWVSKPLAINLYRNKMGREPNEPDPKKPNRVGVFNPLFQISGMNN